MEKSIEQIKGIPPSFDNVVLDIESSYMTLAEIQDHIDHHGGRWEGNTFVWTNPEYRTEEGESVGGERMVEHFDFKYNLVDEQEFFDLG